MNDLKRGSPKISMLRFCEVSVCEESDKKHRFGECSETGPPRRRPNAELRNREYLTDDEIKKLIKAAKRKGRHGHRDATMILVAYRHGLRASELLNLKWSQIDLKSAIIHIRRRKNGISSTHPLYGTEIRALRRLSKKPNATAYVFTTERGGPMAPSTFRKIVSRAGQVADLGMPVHPHMLRHSTGYKLANDGHTTRDIQHYLGHRNIQHTVHYTELARDRFDGFWDE